MTTTVLSQIQKAVAPVINTMMSGVPIIVAGPYIPALKPIKRRPPKPGKKKQRHTSFTMHIYSYSPFDSDFENRGWVLDGVQQLDQQIAICMNSIGNADLYHLTTHYTFANAKGYHWTLVASKSHLTAMGMAKLKPGSNTASFGSMRVFAPIPRQHDGSTTAGTMTDDQLRMYIAGLMQLKKDLLAIKGGIGRCEITIFPSPKGFSHHRLTGTIHL